MVQPLKHQSIFEVIHELDHHRWVPSGCISNPPEDSIIDLHTLLWTRLNQYPSNLFKTFKYDL